MSIEEFIQRFIYESDEDRLDNLFNSIKIYLDEIQDIRTRVASTHLLIKKLRNLSIEYQKML